MTTGLHHYHSPRQGAPSARIADYASRVTKRKILCGEISDAGLRATMIHGAFKWGGEIVLHRSDPPLTRTTRLVARAYAGAFGVKLTDEHDELPGQALTEDELDELPDMRRHVRANHTDPLSRFVMALPLLRGLALASVLAALFFIGFGFAGPFKMVSLVVSFPFAHPHLAWQLTRFAAILAFLFILFLWLAYRFDNGVSAASSTPDPTYAIENFREQSAFGDATHARREQVQQALLGHSGGYAPKFEN